MHALFINRVYPPIGGATGEVLADLARDLVAAGHRVTVVTSATDAAPPGETVEAGVTVRRVRPPRAFDYEHLKRRGTLGRAAGYAALYPALLAGALRGDRPDVVVTKTDPPLHLLLGPVVARRWRARAVHWAQDLYPEVAEAMSVLAPQGRAARLLRRLSTAAMRRHDAVVSLGACMTRRIVARGVASERVETIPNWSLGGVAPVPHAANVWRREHGLDGRFVVMYSGNMGIAHPFEAMLDAAARLAGTDPDVLWLFVGDGARRAWVEAEVARRALGNVRLLPFQPRARLAESLSAADVHVVSMEDELEGLLVPSKMYGVAAAGRPALVIAPPGAEVARFVTGCDGGTVLPGADGEALAGAVRAWKRDPERLAAAGARMAAAAVAGRRASLAAHAGLLVRLASEGAGTGAAQKF